MGKYIDVDQLFQCETCFHHQGGQCDAWCDCGETYRPAMNKLKIVDAEEVKHGAWLHKNGEMVCSMCGEEALMDEVYYESPYCPDCGAKMDRKKGQA